VPEFPPNHTWFNVSRPLTIDGTLKGKLVLIDFWTYCCINCLHVLPDMEYLEQKFKSENSIVFMGCHTAKFLNEQDAEKVRDAILKYEIKHPVINDDKRICWKNFERKSWPGLVILSPNGVPLLILSGEGHRGILDLFLSVAYDFYYDKLNHEARTPWALEEVKEQQNKKALAKSGTIQKEQTKE